MKIMKLMIKQIKGVRQIEILAQPHVNEIAGENGAGKSSVLDSIVYAIGGARAIDAKPLRDGASKGEILLETDEVIITRKFKENGASKLTIKDKLKGGNYGQKFLDSLLSGFTLDPLAFSRMSPKEQVKVLQDMAGPEYLEKVNKLSEEIVNAEQERTFLNRELKKVGVIPEVEPAEPADNSKLQKKIEEIESFNREQTKRKEEILYYEENIKEIKERIEELKEKLTKWELGCKKLSKPEPLKSAEEVALLIAKNEEQNQKAQEYARYKERIDAKSKLARDANLAEEHLLSLRENRQKLQENLKLPIDDVSFGDDGLRVGGIPFEQLSSSEKIKIGLRLGMSANPGLKILFIRDGSLLDKESFKMVKTLAKENDFQVWVETVGGGHGNAVILEEGEVTQEAITEEAF